VLNRTYRLIASSINIYNSIIKNKNFEHFFQELSKRMTNKGNLKEESEYEERQRLQEAGIRDLETNIHELGNFVNKLTLENRELCM